MGRPDVNLGCVADRHALPGERIIEFTSDEVATRDGHRVGGLISIRTRGPRLVVEVYRWDPEVEVTTTRPTPGPPRNEREWRSAIPITPGQLHATTDAETWAQAFVERFAGRMVAPELDHMAVDTTTLVSWFANAIETGRQHGTEDAERAERAAAAAQGLW